MEPHEIMTAQLDRVIPIESVLEQARTFLAECNWKLAVDWKAQVDADGHEEFIEVENEETIITIPDDVELRVRYRSFIKEEMDRGLAKERYEAVVYVGIEPLGESCRAKYLVLMMYFNIKGIFVTEDRLSPPKL